MSDSSHHPFFTSTGPKNTFLMLIHPLNVFRFRMCLFDMRSGIYFWFCGTSTDLFLSVYDLLFTTYFCLKVVNCTNNMNVKSNFIWKCYFVVIAGLGVNLLSV